MDTTSGMSISVVVSLSVLFLACNRVASSGAAVGEQCDRTSPSACADDHAYCAFRSDLSGRTRCTCAFGFAEAGDGDNKRCHWEISVHDDVTCHSCVANHGTCYSSIDRSDRLKDGCTCPPTRASVSSDCDTPLFTVDCDETTMDVCYKHHDLAEHVGIFHDIDFSRAVLYASNYYWSDECHFLPKSDDYCLQLSLDTEGKNCGLVHINSRFVDGYTVEATLQRNVHMQTLEDIVVLAYCRFDKLTGASSGRIEVEEDKVLGAEGEHHRAVLAMRVLGGANENLAEVGIMSGESMRIEMNITDDQDEMFVSLRAEVCVLSNMLSLNHPSTTTVNIVVDSCPTGPLQPEDAFAPEDDNQKLIASGFFPAPRFATESYIFVHCAVKVCTQAAECEPLSCEETRRRRRRSMGVDVLQVFDDSEIQYEVVMIKVRGEQANLVKKDPLIAAEDSPVFPVWATIPIAIMLVIGSLTSLLIIWVKVSENRTDTYAVRIM